ncbi:MAG: ATP-dependent DNA helicase RecG [Actinobacteria bacterium]|nr:ATP-dependent DNA helicase RecG [Actinomycetota bacterium]
MHGLNTPLKEIIGGQTGTSLYKSFGIKTVEDALRHFPHRYATRGELTEMLGLKVDEQVTIMAQITSVTNRPMRNKRGSLLEVVVSDGTGSLKLTFFNQAWRERELVAGRSGMFSGKITEFKGTRQLAHPTYMLIPTDAEPDPEAAAAFSRALIAVYPATNNFPSWRFERIIDLILDGLDPLIKDGLNSDLEKAHGFTTLYQAFVNIHRPETYGQVVAARERFVFEEAFVYQTVLGLRRIETDRSNAIARPPRKDGLLADFDQILPFDLTDGQNVVCEEIFNDISNTHPMHRLLQGEVGSGKTICALRAMLAVVDNGGQAALLAPTEVLASQHYRSIVSMLGKLVSNDGLFDPLGKHSTQVTLLTGSMNTAAKREALLAAASGAAGIVIGTHAIFQDKVQFADLGFVVVDEQHRFGVEQRAALAAKSIEGTKPHVLVMTATPIPRTVAMTVFGDLEISTLSELPKGRIPISTHVVAAQEKPTHLARVWDRIREEVGKGYQAYVVCPKISAQNTSEEESDTEIPSKGKANVEEMFNYLSTGPLAGLRVAQLHGSLASDVKDDVMQSFSRGEIDVLIATTVIEVGVDVPNASVMAIVDAEFFGVSQLHQLRGRVGRGKVPGLCLLVTNSEADSSTRERIEAVASTLDGFELSRIDLEQRREGDVLGASQSGRRSGLRMLQVVRDEDVIAKAREIAWKLLQADPELKNNLSLAKRIKEIQSDEKSEFLEKT